jgi:hypothetical protein
MYPQRGSYRGGKRSWGSETAFRHPRPTQNLPPPLPLGAIIDRINIKAILIEETAPTIENVEYVASYNWVEGKSPVILVPGQLPESQAPATQFEDTNSARCLESIQICTNMSDDIGSPPAWTPPAIDSKLKPDSEDVFRDINAARYASYPLEPMIRSLQAMQAQYDLQAVDVVGCGSTLGNLLRYAGSQPKSFRFDVDVINDIVFFVRKERSPTEIIADLYGYGHTFPEEYTTWDYDVRNSCSHQRIIQYEFHDLKFLVRSETDGYIKEANAKVPLSAANELSLDDALGKIAVSSTGSSKGSKLQMKMQGMRVRQDQIFDIKTRALHKPFDMNEIFPRLWMNQTSKFLIAYHKSGLFDKPMIKDVREDIIQWEKDNATLLARFHALVKRIVDVVRDSDQQQCEVSWDGEGPLCITEQIGKGRRALPSDLVDLLEN